MTRVATRNLPTRLGALAAALMLSAAAIPAQAEPDMASIQAQIDQMKADYEAAFAAGGPGRGDRCRLGRALPLFVFGYGPGV